MGTLYQKEQNLPANVLETLGNIQPEASGWTYQWCLHGAVYIGWIPAP